MATSLIKSYSWKNGGSATGSVDISISSLEFSELLVEVFVNKGENREFVLIPKGALAPTNPIYVRQGSGGSTGEQMIVTIYATLNAVRCAGVKFAGTDYTSTSITRVWYR